LSDVWLAGLFAMDRTHAAGSAVETEDWVAVGGGQAVPGESGVRSCEPVAWRAPRWSVVRAGHPSPSPRAHKGRQGARRVGCPYLAKGPSIPRGVIAAAVEGGGIRMAEQAYCVPPTFNIRKVCHCRRIQKPDWRISRSEAKGYRRRKKVKQRKPHLSIHEINKRARPGQPWIPRYPPDKEDIIKTSHFPDGSIPAPTGAVDRPGSEGNLTTPATSPSRQTELEPHQTGDAIWLKRGDTAVD